MKEFVGYCVSCKREIYCYGGNLDGIVQSDQSLRCHDCDRQILEEKNATD